MRTFVMLGALALLSLVTGSPAVAQHQRIHVCVIDAGRLVELEVDYDRTTGDTLLSGKRFSDVHPAGSKYAAAANWYINNDPIQVAGANYVKYGLPRVLGVMEVTRIAEYENVLIFAETGAVGSPEVVYVPVRPGCEFQPYAVEIESKSEDVAVFDIEYSESYQGELEPNDEMDLDEAFIDFYAFHGEAGDTAIIELRSDDFDAYLSLENWDTGEQLASNDDGFDSGTDARIVFPLPAAGEYFIVASSLFPDEVGDYSLSLERAGYGATRAKGTISAGESVSGTLSAEDPRLSDGSYYDEYRISVRAGQRLVVTMESKDFDTYLIVGESTNGEYDHLESNDDGDGMGTDSRIELRFDIGGEFLIRANSLLEEETGSYRLTVIDES